MPRLPAPCKRALHITLTLPYPAVEIRERYPSWPRKKAAKAKNRDANSVAEFIMYLQAQDSITDIDNMRNLLNQALKIHQDEGVPTEPVEEDFAEFLDKLTSYSDPEEEFINFLESWSFYFNEEGNLYKKWLTPEDFRGR